MRILILSVVIVLVSTYSISAADPSTYDQRFGVVATDSSGWGHDIMPVQGPQYFDQLHNAWWYNYTPQLASAQVPGLTLFWPGYQRLYMFWKAVATTSDATIQNYAIAAKAADPNATIWWAMSNEPNDRGQANQTGASFARIYLKHHKNLRIADPTCKVIGPGLLDWRFTNSSCYQSGKSWYEEFRNAWAADPECVAYSQSVNGTNYPPQDGFSLHSYHLSWPSDWRWCRDDMQACYNDLQTYPETVGLKIWNTEYGSLGAPSLTQSADMMSGLTLWMREQPWMERWFLFFTHNDKYASLDTCQLFDDTGAITQLGQAYQDIASLPTNAAFYHFPFHARWDQAADYVRPSWNKTTAIIETPNAPGERLHLVQNSTYSANTMRGRKFKPVNGYVYKVRFNYLTNYDNAKCVLAMDTPLQNAKWQVDEFGSKTGYVEIDLSDNPVEYVSFGLFIKSGFTYTQPTGEWQAVIANLMLLTCLGKPTVDDGGAVTLNNTIHAGWTTPTGGAQPISEYQYAIGTSPGATDTLDWTSAGTANSVTVEDIPLQNDVTYYVSVKAKDALGNWGLAGVSDGIKKILSVPKAADAKAMQPGTYLALENMTVSAVLSDRIYVQHPDRSSGIAVVGPPGYSVGNKVTVGGSLQVIDGEVVLSGNVISVSEGSSPIPLALTNLSSGGGACGAQQAVTDNAAENKYAVGPSNIGLLVKTWGKATHVDPSGRFIYIDDGSGLSDGSGYNGVRVSIIGMPTPKRDSYVTATGISSATMVNGKVVRLIRPRNIDDMWYERAENCLGNSGFETGILSPWIVIGTAGEVKSGTWYLGATAHSGGWFYGCYASYTVKNGVIYQRAMVEPGKSYTAGCYSAVLHGANEADAAMNRIGIDPTGGTDPNAATVVWSAWDMQESWYVSEWRYISTPAVAVLGDKATVFLQYFQQNNTGYHMNCFDDILLSELN